MLLLTLTLLAGCHGSARIDPIGVASNALPLSAVLDGEGVSLGLLLRGTPDALGPVLMVEAVVANEGAADDSLHLQVVGLSEEASLAVPMGVEESGLLALQLPETALASGELELELELWAEAAEPLLVVGGTVTAIASVGEGGLTLERVD